MTEYEVKIETSGGQYRRLYISADSRAEAEKKAVVSAYREMGVQVVRVVDISMSGR